jgi:signal transduction histidine kinase
MRYVSILILEDCQSYCDCLKEELDSCENDYIKFSVHTTNSIDEAKEFLQIIDINFVILDLNLSGESGEDFLDYINNNSKSNAKAIVLTQNEDSKRREKLFEKDIIDYLSKKNHVIQIASDITKIVEVYYENINKKILIVDPISSSRKKLQRLYKNRNYKIIKVDSIDKAIKLLDVIEFDLVLIDLDIKISKSNNLIYTIRSHRKNKDMPIIVLSSNDDYENISQALKSGANEFIRKPYRLEDIILKSTRVLELHSSQQKLHQVNKELKREVLKAKKEATRRVEQESMCEQQSRRAAMGEMIINIAHQWKQPLTALSALIQTIELKDRLNKLTKESIQSSVSQSKELIDYMSTTIDDFQEFLNPNRDREAFDINSIIDTNLTIISHILKLNSINTIINIDTNLKIYGHKNELSQSILNILNNAKDILLTQNIDDRYIFIDAFKSKITYFNDGMFITIPSVTITIHDSAGGIPDEIIDKIFDPYYTTKHKAQGTGIGLYMVRQIIEGKFKGQVMVSNADISYHDKEYFGAKFQIKVPLTSK